MFQTYCKNREGLPRAWSCIIRANAFTAKYVPLLETAAKERDVELQTVHIRGQKTTRKCPVSFTTFSLFRDGEFVTHEILSEKKFDKSYIRLTAVKDNYPAAASPKFHLGLPKPGIPIP